MLYRALELTLAPALRAVYRPGDHRRSSTCPPHGPVIFAGNHISFADEFFTPLAARRQVVYFAKAEYFTTPGRQGPAMARCSSPRLGQVPVERADTRAAASVIDIGVDVLREGRALGIFPEGTRSPDGRLYKFRTGVARVALRSGAPVVPVGLVGTREVQPPGERMWHRAPVGVHFGAPLHFGDRAAEERSARVLREVTETSARPSRQLSRPGLRRPATRSSAARVSGPVCVPRLERGARDLPSRSPTSSSPTARAAPSTACRSTVERGTLLALLGPNGAGKTTTIEICEGFRRADAGSGARARARSAADPALRPRVGVMLQDGVGGYREARGARAAAAVRRLRRAPARPGRRCSTSSGSPRSPAPPVKRLSGGQQQRLSLALALVAPSRAGVPGRADRRHGPAGPPGHLGARRAGCAATA